MSLKGFKPFQHIKNWITSEIDTHRQNEVHAELQPTQTHAALDHSQAFLSVSGFNTESGYFSSGDGTRTIQLSNTYSLGVASCSHVVYGGSTDYTHGARVTDTRPAMGEFDITHKNSSSEVRVNWKWIGILD